MSVDAKEWCGESCHTDREVRFARRAFGFPVLDVAMRMNTSLTDMWKEPPIILITESLQNKGFREANASLRSYNTQPVTLEFQCSSICCSYFPGIIPRIKSNFCASALFCIFHILLHFFHHDQTWIPSVSAGVVGLRGWLVH